MAQEEIKVGSSNKVCLVCKGRTGSLFRFPKSGVLREQWEEDLRLEKSSVTGSSRVCYRHFKPEDIKKCNGLSRLVKGARPNPTDKSPEAKARHSCTSHDPVCIVPGCGKKGENGVTLHMFPRLYDRRSQWANLLSLPKVPSRWTLICSIHFPPEQFHATGRCRTLKSTATPSLNLCLDSTSSRGSAPGGAEDVSLGEYALPAVPVTEGSFSLECSADSDKFIGAARDCEDPHLGDSLPMDIEGPLGPDNVNSDNFIDIATRIIFGPDGHVCSEEGGVEESCTGTGDVAGEEDPGLSAEEVISAADGAEAEVLKSVFKRLSSTLRSDIDTILCSEDTLVGSASDVHHVGCESATVGTQTDPQKYTLFDLLQNDTQLKAFTGVSFSTLNCLVKLLSEIQSDSDKCRIPMKNRIVLTLCKLRLNLSYECLGVLVGIDRRRCGEIFASTLKMLAAVLKHTVLWPSKEDILLNMPKCFAKFRDTRVILDCTEIPVISPDCLKCRIRLYSHYKKGHTVKVLVGVAPSGLITFMSKAYGGRASDKHIFEESDLISKDLLDPFVDAVMVDKGFRIDSALNERGIKMYRPPFVEKRQPLSAPNARYNAEIANARVHVERVIQRLKIFKILQSKIAWSMTPFLDDIFIVLAGLVNLSPPVMSDDKFLTYEKTRSA